MFQTTNQITIIFPLLLVYSLWKPLFSPSLWTDGKESSNSTVRGFGASTWKNGCNTWLQALFVTWEFMGHFLCPHGSHHPTMNGIWSIINGYFFRWCPLYSQNGTLTNPWNWRWLKKKKNIESQLVGGLNLPLWKRSVIWLGNSIGCSLDQFIVSSDD